MRRRAQRADFDYIASEFEIIGNATGFCDYLEEGGQFSSDLFRTLSNELL